MGKTIKQVFKVAKILDPVLTLDRKLVKGITDNIGLSTPEDVKRKQRAAQAQAEASAAAAKLASENLQKNQLVDLADASNSPDVVAGGTAQDLALGGGDMKRKRVPTLSTQLGVRV